MKPSTPFDDKQLKITLTHWDAFCQRGGLNPKRLDDNTWEAFKYAYDVAYSHGYCASVIAEGKPYFRVTRETCKAAAIAVFVEYDPITLTLRIPSVDALAVELKEWLDCLQRKIRDVGDEPFRLK